MMANVQVHHDDERFDCILEVAGAQLLCFDEGEHRWIERGPGAARIQRGKQHSHQHWFSHRLDNDNSNAIAAKRPLVSGMTFVEPHGDSETHFIWAVPKKYDDDSDDSGDNDDDETDVDADADDDNDDSGDDNDDDECGAVEIFALCFATNDEALRFAAAVSRLATVPVPAVVLSDAVLFADPAKDVLTKLGMSDLWSAGLAARSPHWDAVARGAAHDTWSDALVLATPFWAPGNGKLNVPVDLGAWKVPSLVAASIAFDPDRELIVKSMAEDVDSECTTAVFSTARRVRLDFPVCHAGSTDRRKNSVDIRVAVKHLAMLRNLRELTFAGRWDLADLNDLASLKTLRSLTLKDCTEKLADLTALASFPDLEKLHFGGVFNFQDVSMLAILGLQELSIAKCKEVTEFSSLMTIPTLKLNGLGGWALEPLVDLITDSNATPTVIRSATSSLAHLSKPLPDADAIAPTLAEVVRLFNHEDELFVAAGASALAYLSDANIVRIQRVIDTGCLPRMVELLGSNLPALVEPALLTCGNVVTGSDRQAKLLFDNGVLPALLGLLNHSSDDKILKEVCWMLSNITAGNQDQIQAVIDAGLIPALMQTTTSPSLRVGKEALWAIANMTSGGSHGQIEDLVNIGVLPCVFALIENRQEYTKIVSVVLEAIDNILDAGDRRCENCEDDRNPYTEEMKTIGGLEMLETLVKHPNTDIHNHAQLILETYFGWEGKPGHCYSIL